MDVIFSSRWATVYALSLAVFAANMGFGIVVPALPVYARSLGASDVMIGFLFAAFGIGRVAANLLAGLLTSRFDWKHLMLLGLGLTAATMVTAAFAADFLILLSMRLVEGAGSGIFMTVSTTTVARLSPIGVRGKSIGLYSSMLPLGTVVGPAMGGFIIPIWGANSTFICYALAVSVGLVICQLFVKRSTVELKTSDTSSLGGLGSTTIDRSVLHVCIGTFASSLVWAGVALTLVPLFAYDNLRLLPFQLGLVLAGTALAKITLALLSGVMTDRFGRKRPVVFSLLALSIILTLLPFSRDFHTMALIMILFGATDGFFGQLVAWTADLSPSKQMGMSISLSRIANDLGFVIGPVFLTFIVQLTRTELVSPHPFIMTAVILSAVSMSLFRVKDPSRR